MGRGRPKGTKGYGSKEFVRLVEMIIQYNSLRHTFSRAKLKHLREAIYDFQLDKNVELGGPISMHLK